MARWRRHFDLRQTFSSLRHRNYRLWFWGQMVSLFGTWMQVTAQGFLVYELTRSSAYLGYVGFAAGLPSWLLMPLGGVVADRMRRRDLLLITQSAMMGLAFLLAALTFLGIIRPWQIVGLAFLLGVANAFDAPARHAFVPDMVGRDDLTNAIALNSTVFNSATVFGPAVAGITYALFGPGWCFLINALSFGAVIAALLLMNLGPAALRGPSSSPWKDLKEGFGYVLSHPMIRVLIGLVGMTSVFGVSFVVLIPAWAVEVLGGNATTNGWLYSARGAGALLGALAIASLGRFNFKGKLLASGTLAFPALLLGFAFVRWLPLSLVLILANGVTAILIFNLANALVQTLVRDSLRGRVMAIYSLTFFGFMPLGALWVGVAAEKLGEPAAIIVNGSILLAFSMLIWIFLPRLRQLN
ncbi:MAG: MFS transporter [Candidatus Aminicenantes bacterium]|nr:MFS transporter [Candidatus Aminicenantes bacterium]